MSLKRLLCADVFIVLQTFDRFYPRHLSHVECVVCRTYARRGSFGARTHGGGSND